MKILLVLLLSMSFSFVSMAKSENISVLCGKIGKSGTLKDTKNKIHSLKAPHAKPFDLPASGKICIAVEMAKGKIKKIHSYQTLDIGFCRPEATDEGVPTSPVKQ